MQPIVPPQSEQFHSAHSQAHSQTHSQHQQNTMHPVLGSQSPPGSHEQILHQQQQQPQIIVTSQNRETHTTSAGPNYPTGKHRSTSYYGQRYSPMLSAPSSSASPSTAGFPQVSTSQPSGLNQSISYIPHGDPQHTQLLPQNLVPSSGIQAPGTTPSIGVALVRSKQPLTHSSTVPIRSQELLLTNWTTTPMAALGQSYETKYASGSADLIAQDNAAAAATAVAAAAAIAPSATNHPSLITNNFYARSLHTPFYQMELHVPPPETVQLHYSATLGQGFPGILDPAVVEISNGSRLPAFDIKAYTFRKKSRHYVAVKQKNALRIEPIIYLKTSILDPHRDVVRNWDYLRFSVHRFRENALPKKKLTVEEMKTAKILDVNITLVSPNNKNRLIEDSCPACVMRMDGERKIMQVLAKNFKMTPSGEPVIDIRKGHAIVCIKLNCYCDHHNEQEGFVVRMQTEPEVVLLGGSVKLRICCEARSKLGPSEPDAEEEDGLTDIDAPVSTGSRSPLNVNDRSAQSPSLSYGSQSPEHRIHRQRQPSSTSSSSASPKSMNERVVSSLAVEPSLLIENVTPARAPISPPKFRKIYPLTPSEGTCLGGTRVTIHGANFDMMQNPVVYFGKIPAELVTVSHHDVMECTTPPAEGLKPGIVAVRIASLTSPLGAESDNVDFMYMAPPEYDFYNLAATSLSYAMSNEYPGDNSLSFVLNAHGSGLNGGFGLPQGSGSFTVNTGDLGLVWGTMEGIAIDFMKVIQKLSPGRVIPAFKSQTGCTLLHLAAYYGMAGLTKELLDMGIDHTAVDRNNKTALQYALASAHTTIVEAISEARVPPRPMVPRLDAKEGDTQITMKEIVTALIRKYEGTLQEALSEEQERRLKEFDARKERTLQVIEYRDRPTTADLPDFSGKIEDTDMEADDIAIFSGESSPTRSIDGEEEQRQRMSVDQDLALEDSESRKRKADEDEASTGSQSNLKKSSKCKDDGTRNYIDPVQLALTQTEARVWESTRGTDLFKDLKLATESDSTVRTWACESATVTPLSDSVLDPANPIKTSPSTGPPAISVLALSQNGLHLYTERLQEFATRAPAIKRSMQHWSLVEIDSLKVIQTDSGDALVIDMCGLVERRNQDMLGERIQIQLTTSLDNSMKDYAMPANVRDVINSSRIRLNTQPKNISDDAWMQVRLDMWSALYNVEKAELATAKSDTLSFEEGTLKLSSALLPRRQYSVNMIGAILRTARDLDTCASIRFSGATVDEEGWSRPELISQLEKTVRAMRHVTRWEFNSCRWAVNTVEGLIRGLTTEAPPGDVFEGKPQQCKDISLAGNRLGGNNAIGPALLQCVKSIKLFECLDLTGCDIGLEGMEVLVKQLSGLTELRFHGNRFDQRWWSWMDTVLERNPQLQRCSLGAPIPALDPLKSFLSLEKLLSLEDLVELDLSGTIMAKPTLEALNSRVHHLRTLSLAHCQLSWSALIPLFDAICDKNDTTKFTLNVSKNPLFHSDAEIEAWVSSVRSAKVKVAFGIQMTDLVITDSNLQRILEPMGQATCFNELNTKGLCLMSPEQEPELKFLSYDEMRARVKPVDASEESCRALGQVLINNTTLLMLDVSGNPSEKTEPSDDDDSTNSDPLTLDSHVSSYGGFGPKIALAFPTLDKNTTLRVLTIDHNRFGDENTSRLCDALKYNHNLRILSIDGNNAFTPTGLRAIENMFSPDDDGESLGDAEGSEGEGTGGSGGGVGGGSVLRNSTIAIWKPNPEEILTHIHHLTMKVARLQAEYDRIEKLQATSMNGVDIRFMGSTPLPDVQRRWHSAEQNRISYSDTYERIIKAIKGNYDRTSPIS